MTEAQWDALRARWAARDARWEARRDRWADHVSRPDHAAHWIVKLLLCAGLMWLLFGG